LVVRNYAPLESDRSLGLHELEAGADVDRSGEASSYGTEAGVKLVHAFGVRPPFLRDGEAIIDPDPLDHEDAVVGFDLPDRFDLVALRIDLDLTRFQRAGKGARQSPAGCRDYVVERRCMRRILRRFDAVVLSYL
jgi:hypothetical protein